MFSFETLKDQKTGLPSLCRLAVQMPTRPEAGLPLGSGHSAGASQVLVRDPVTLSLLLHSRKLETETGAKHEAQYYTVRCRRLGQQATYLPLELTFMLSG